MRAIAWCRATVLVARPPMGGGLRPVWVPAAGRRGPRTVATRVTLRQAATRPMATLAAPPDGPAGWSRDGAGGWHRDPQSGWPQPQRGGFWSWESQYDRPVGSPRGHSKDA